MVLLLVFCCLSVVGQTQGPGNSQAPDTNLSAAKPKVVPPKVIKSPDPEPLSDFDKGLIVFRVTIGIDGLVHDPVLVKSSASKKADANALEALKKWKFKPATRDGVPIPVSINIEVNQM
jgi:TonB family protein